MIGFLLVLALIISRASQPATWTWLTGEPAQIEQPTVQVHPVRNEPQTIAPGPTDEDPEELEAAKEQFQALTDGAIELGREEMPAYWRLFNWTEHQSYDVLNKRATGDVVLNQFMQSPNEQRGKLYRLDLNVRRVLAYNAPDNSAGIKKVYEVWGWTTESKAWLYCVLTAHLPPGMPVGPDVYERVTFAGYFLKVQGYHAAGAGPKDKPLAAPLLIGRLSWKESPVAQPAADPPWLWWLGGVVLLYATARFAWWMINGRASTSMARSSAREARSASNIRGWLADAQSSDDEIPETSALKGFGNNGKQAAHGLQDYREN